MLQDLSVDIIWGKCMKKHKIIILLLLTVLVFAGFVFYSTIKINCGYYYYLENRPDAQENTVWSSENGKILLYINEKSDKKISFEENGAITECYFVSDRGYFAYVFDMEAFEKDRLGLYPEECYEKWAYKNVSEDSFTIMAEETVFLKVGDEITFHKTG